MGNGRRRPPLLDGGRSCPLDVGWRRGLTAEMRAKSIVTVGLGLLLSAAALVQGEEQSTPPPALPIIALQPLGTVPQQDIAAVRAGIVAVYAVEVRVVPAVALPKAAYYPPRERYRAELLLDFLEDERGFGFEALKVVGLTAADISTTKGEVKDYGILGLGTIEGPSCVISTFRMGAHKASAAKRSERLVKVVNHEIGHTFGLEHCPTAGCLMQDVKGTITTVDAEKGGFCAQCQEMLGGRLFPKK